MHSLVPESDFAGFALPTWSRYVQRATIRAAIESVQFVHFISRLFQHPVKVKVDFGASLAGGVGKR